MLKGRSVNLSAMEEHVNSLHYKLEISATVSHSPPDAPEKSPKEVRPDLVLTLTQKLRHS